VGGRRAIKSDPKLSWEKYRGDSRTSGTKWLNHVGQQKGKDNQAGKGRRTPITSVTALRWRINNTKGLVAARCGR